jgi:hypothetical protein
MYFEIVKRPRYVGQQKEFEVELQYTSGILGYPERIENEGKVDDQSSVAPSSRGLLSNTRGSLSASGIREQTDEGAELDADESGGQKELAVSGDGSNGGGGSHPEIDFLESQNSVSQKDEIQFTSASETSGLSFVPN